MYAHKTSAHKDFQAPGVCFFEKFDRDVPHLDPQHIGLVTVYIYQLLCIGSKALNVRLVAVLGVPDVIVGLYAEPGAGFADAC